ncbi:MAG: alpha/beta fold hydrolase [Syntrophales bacterium]
MNAPESKFVTVNRLKLHYLEWNECEEPAMILLHGIGDNGYIWEHFARMSADYFRIIAPDQRGHGRSEWAIPPAYCCDDYVSDISALIDTLKLNRLILMGHSMGALHATRYASLHPEKIAALIHVDIEPCPPAWNKKYLANLYESLPDTYESVEEYIEQARINSPFADRETLLAVALRSLDRGVDGKFRRQYDREVLRCFDAYDLRPDLRNIRCPSLIVRGRQSRVMSREKAREMSLEIPNGRLAEIPEAAHPVHTDNPRGFGRAVLDFLSGISLIARRTSGDEFQKNQDLSRR